MLGRLARARSQVGRLGSHRRSGPPQRPHSVSGAPRCRLGAPHCQRLPAARLGHCRPLGAAAASTQPAADTGEQDAPARGSEGGEGAPLQLQLTPAAVRGLSEYTCLAACVAELRQELVPAKVDGVRQTEASVVALRLRTTPRGAAARVSWLYLSWRPEAALLCTGDAPGPATSAASHYPFGQQLHAELQGLVLQGLELPQPWERVARLSFGRGLSADPQRLLFFEPQGNRSNLVLTDPEPGLKILATGRGVGAAQSSLRQLQVGAAYALPPPQAQKQDPSLVTSSEGLQGGAAGRDGEELAQWLCQSYKGMGPSLAAQLSRAAGVSPGTPLQTLSGAHWEALHSAWQRWLQAVAAGSFRPTVSPSGDAVSPLGLVGADIPGGMRAAMRAGLQQAAGSTAAAQKQRLMSVVRAALKRARGKHAALTAQQAAGEEAERTRKRADLIMANLHLHQPGAAHLEVTDWETGEAVSIPLDAASPAVEQAEALYKRARRQGRTPASIQPVLEACAGELEYLAGCESQLEQLGDDELQEGLLLGLQEELVAGKYMRPPSDAAYAEKALRRSQQQQQKGPARGGRVGRFRCFTSPGGLQVLVGRNNRENDDLTHRVAARTDLWFHARGFPGSHTVLRVPPGREAAAGDVQFAADLAAYFSKARAEGKVYVVKAAVSDLKKPKGAHPGQVLVTREASVLARPQAGREAAGGAAD